jgi:maleylacetoacetate isomerase
VAYETVPVNIRSGEQFSDGYRALNPSAGVPTLVDGELGFAQSLAILDYLDQTHPEPLLVPREQPLRARVLEFAHGIASDIHPVNNLRVLRYLTQQLGISEAQKNAWYQHWIDAGLGAANDLLRRHGRGPYCFGDVPTLADCCLVPQVANALRTGCRLDAFDRVMAVYRHASEQPAFVAASPAKQPDYIA